MLRYKQKSFKQEVSYYDIAHYKGYEIMSSLTRNDMAKELQELKRDIMEYFDLIIRRLTRLRMIEERLDTIEEYLAGLRRRVRRMEILLKDYTLETQHITSIKEAEPLIQRPSIQLTATPMRRLGEIENVPETKETKTETKIIVSPIRQKKTVKATERKMKEKAKETASQITSLTQQQSEDILSKLDKLTITEKQIVKILAKNPELRGGTAIARKIGKAREHTSRLLKKLAEEGILVRDESVWPYRYIVPENIKQYIILEDQLKI